ncbi:Phenylacetaldehyde reductase [Fulvia fulva]|nr:Phenylacetaldehyde reductase [Fulvia fulva]KAK4621055.1 Phenylacetaldehyde reductase [Fulvia fulva]WPV17752.1 Phenylacetaldehyde reductase [Fulvia fulva]WPV32247.1 Phenylacetaldehyde reductase [Fulvia fulva]
MASSQSDLVLVTGGSGFLGSHLILQLLSKGYTVRTTVRSTSRIEETRAKLSCGGATQDQIAKLEIRTLDLVTDSNEAWTKACSGAEYVLHTAGMIATGKEKQVDDLLVPMREGTLRVLRAAKAAGVPKVVFTSSIASIAHGHGKRGKSEPFTEEDWTDLTEKKEQLHIYPKAKTLQEQAVWDFIKSPEGQGLEIAVICPGAIYGPTLSKEYASSLKLIGILLGGMPGVPQYGTAMVDVRDVADLHIKVMESPKTHAQKYLAISGRADEIEPASNCVCEFVSMVRAADILRKNLPAEKTSKLPTRTLPNFVMRAAGYFDPVVGVCLPDLGKELAGSFVKARSELGWQPRSVDEALLASANSHIEFGVV